jgi:hypothetical protein
VAAADGHVVSSSIVNDENIIRVYISPGTRRFNRLRDIDIRTRNLLFSADTKSLHSRNKRTSPVRIRLLWLLVLHVAGTTLDSFCGTSKIAFSVLWRPDICKKTRYMILRY